MHRNYRRKPGRWRSRKSMVTLPAGHCRWAQRHAWKKARQAVRQALLHEREDEIQNRYPRHVRWDYW